MRRDSSVVEQLTCNEQVPGSNPGLGSEDHRLANSWYTCNMQACLNCANLLTRRWQSKYCSNKCQADFQYKTCVREWKSNSAKGMRSVATKNVSGHLRRYLIEKHGEACSVCGWNERHPITKRVPLEVDHIDGNSDNNQESNLRIICPNCHSLTIHFRNLNRTRGRKWRIKYLKQMQSK